MLVYVVVPGERDTDYCIYGIFTTKQQADKWIDNNQKMYGGKYDIEIYEADPPIEPIKKHILFTGKIENDFVTDREFTFCCVDEPRPIRFYRTVDGSFTKYVEGTISVDQNEISNTWQLNNKVFKLVKEEFTKWIDKNALACKPVGKNIKVYKSSCTNFDAYVKEFKKYSAAYIYDTEDKTWLMGSIVGTKFYDVTTNEPDKPDGLDYDYSATFVDNDKFVDVYILTLRKISEPDCLEVIRES